MPRKGTLTKTVTLADGSRKWIYGKTKKELDEKVKEIMHLDSLEIDVRNVQTFGEYAQQWIDIYKKDKVQPTTLRNYVMIINAYLLPYLSGYRMRDIKAAHIQKMFNELSKSGKAEGTLERTRTVLSSILTSAAENGIIVRSPMTSDIKVGGRQTTPRTALTPEQVNTLLSNLDKRTDYLFVKVALGTGMRIGELTGLTWNDVDLENMQVNVSHAIGYDYHGAIEHRDPKTANGYRTIPFGQETAAAFRELRQISKGLYVFTTKDCVHPLTACNGRLLNKRLDAALGDKDIHVTAHVLRHTYCTRLFESMPSTGLGIDEISYLMGHGNISVTQNIYTHYLKEHRLTDTARKLRLAAVL